mmetsp:Transcript_99534/g.197251  ORF Transcript_99534/g.197251 Transcript_99534/m.197251 type:complete len:222 (+) Transcript_99534:1656-2321(+)
MLSAVARHAASADCNPVCSELGAWRSRIKPIKYSWKKASSAAYFTWSFLRPPIAAQFEAPMDFSFSIGIEKNFDIFHMPCGMLRSRARSATSTNDVSEARAVKSQPKLFLNLPLSARSKLATTFTNLGSSRNPASHGGSSVISVVRMMKTASQQASCMSAMGWSCPGRLSGFHSKSRPTSSGSPAAPGSSSASRLWENSFANKSPASSSHAWTSTTRPLKL